MKKFFGKIVLASLLVTLPVSGAERALNKVTFSNFDMKDEVFEICIMDDNGTNIKQLTNTPKIMETNPAINPVTKDIFFSRCTNDPDADTEIWKMKMDGSSQTKVKIDGVKFVDVRAIDISADGKKMVFNANTDGFSDAVCIADIDGKNAKILAHKPDVSRFNTVSFSPDGKTVLFGTDIVSGDDEKRFIGKVNVADNKVTMFANDPNCWDPAFSPDGKKIVYEGWGNMTYQISVMNADGTDKKVLAKTIRPYCFPKFSPDGKYVMYQDRIEKEIPDSEEIEAYSVFFIVPADGGEPKEICRRDYVNVLYDMSWE